MRTFRERIMVGIGTLLLVAATTGSTIAGPGIGVIPPDPDRFLTYGPQDTRESAIAYIALVDPAKERDTFDAKFVPVGWQPSEKVPAFSPELYLEVVAQSCRACHAKRGAQAGADHSGEIIDFSTYTKFAEYAPAIEAVVFEESYMPHTLRTFDHFWHIGDHLVKKNQPELLAQFLELELPAFGKTFKYRTEDGSLILPTLDVFKDELELMDFENELKNEPEM